MQALPLLALEGLGLIVLGYIVNQTVFRQQRQLPLPPGPKPWPIIGNLLDVPKVRPWEGYAEWGRKYGNIFSLRVLGQVIVVVNSPTIARDLLEKRGSMYSSRPSIAFVELADSEWALPFSHYGSRWRSGRRILEGSLRQGVISQYWPIQRARAYDFIASTLHAPGDFRLHITYAVAAISLEVVYGYKCTDPGDGFVLLSEKATKIMTESLLPGAMIVNTFPFLRHFPRWLPGMGFHKLAAESKYLNDRLRDVPYDHMKETLLSLQGSNALRPSMVSEILNATRDKGVSAEDEQAMKEAAGSVYGASVETARLRTRLDSDRRTDAHKAQAEIEAVIGTERLPDFGDRPKLPYVEALCMELSRWRLAAPLGVVHSTTEDDVYNGFFIPKGSTVWANAWAMLHDPVVYPDPESFTPERFLTPDGLVKEDPLWSSVFGFGRRKCPGRHLADATIWIFVTSVLATLIVRPPKDHQGLDIPLDDVGLTTGLVR
ncbi:cytochrome P450 [Amylostereum chailletii]|nr:cytochrome P450 [Amylostereum chailletii]